jgi:hypothetical protein
MHIGDRMKLRVLLLSLLMLSFWGLFPSLANAACGAGDTGVCDTVRIGCPFIIPTIIPGDSIMVPIYLWNDQIIEALSFGFKFDGAELEVVKERYSLTGSVIPEGGIENGLIKERIVDTIPGQYLFGWIDMSGQLANRIPVNTIDKAKLLVTLNFKIKSSATPKTVVIDSAFYPPGGRFVLAVAGSSAFPQYVHCPQGDIILGNTLCGDADGSGNINIADIVYIIDYIFKQGPPPHDANGGDIDCDLRVTIADVVYFINYVFRGGLPPCFECL